MTWAEAVAAGRAPGYYPVHPHWTAVPDWVTGYQLGRLRDLGMVQWRFRPTQTLVFTVMEWRMRPPAGGEDVLPCTLDKLDGLVDQVALSGGLDSAARLTSHN